MRMRMTTKGLWLGWARLRHRYAASCGGDASVVAAFAAVVVVVELVRLGLQLRPGRSLSHCCRCPSWAVASWSHHCCCCCCRRCCCYPLRRRRNYAASVLRLVYPRLVWVFILSLLLIYIVVVLVLVVGRFTYSFTHKWILQIRLSDIHCSIYLSKHKCYNIR